MTTVEQIGRYQILGELGRGAMGLVYKAQDPAIGRTIAIKSIRLLDLTSDAERERLRERLVREAQSAGVLSHPGIVTIYDIAEENGTAYIFLEFVPGQPLEKMLLAAQPPDGETMLSIFRQTAAALDYAHRKGIVHRDIKPANIMIHEDGSAKITDFGVAKIMSQQMTQAGTMMGTPSYMSPEQVQGVSVDGRADQFALAVIAYEVLTGEKPFVADYLPTLLYKIVREDPLPVSLLNNTLGPAVEAVFRRALSKLPEDRYDTCAEFIAALSAACNASLGWVPLPRGASHELPTVGSGDRGGGSTMRPAPRFNAATETVADQPMLIAASTPPPLPAAIPPPVLPAFAAPPEPTIQPPPFNPPAPLELHPALESYAPRWEAPPPLETPSLEPPNMEQLMPRVAPMAVERRLATDPLASEGASSKALRNVILAAAAVALVSVGVFLAVQRYNAAPEVGQTQPPPVVNPSQPIIPPPPPVTTPPAATDPAAANPSSANPASSTPSAATPTTTATSPPPATEPESAPEAPKAPPAVKTTPQRRAASEASSFQLTTSPSGAVAVFDADPGTQCITPCKMTLPAGRHTIALHHTGYRDAQRIVETPRDPGLIVDLVAMSGTLSLSSNPPGLTVAIDGREQTRKTPLSITVPVGRHRVDFLKGGERQTVTVDIQDGEISTKSIDWSQ